MSKRIQHNQSKSLWNYTLSPGWRRQESQILKLAVKKFGVGKWKKIVKANCLPYKSIGQIYMQTQRLLGQQSLAEFMGLHLDIDKIRQMNEIKQATRKNRFIINTNDNLTKEEIKQKIKQNQINFGLSEQQIKSIRLPRWKTQNFLTLQQIETDKLSTLQKLIELEALKKEIEKRLEQ